MFYLAKTLQQTQVITKKHWMCNCRGVIITQHYEGWELGGFDGGVGGGGVVSMADPDT